MAIEGGIPAIDERLCTARDPSGRLIGDEGLRLLHEVIETRNLACIYRDKVGRFEERFARLIGADRAVAISGG